MKYKLVIFDWEGTLVDGSYKVIQGLQNTASAMGLAPFDEREAYDLIHLELQKIVVSLYPEMSLHQLTLFNAHYLKEMASSQTCCRLHPDCEKMLSLLISQGLLLAIATGASKAHLNQDLEALELKGVFDAIQTASDNAAKPNPEMLEAIFSFTGVLKQRAVMVGDSLVDMQMAQNAGIDALGFTLQGDDKRQQLLDAGAIEVFDNYTELLNYLQSS